MEATSEVLLKERIVPVRIAFIGAGAMAEQHFQTLSSLDNAQCVAFCDSDFKRAEEAARRFEGRAYRDARKMFEAESIDAVYVCLPPHAHKDSEILATQNGCALFIEKPVSNNLRTAARIAQAIEDAGVPSCVGYQFRYLSGVERVQKLTTGKGAPAIAMMSGRWWGGLPNRAWWRRIDQGGGQIVEQMTHIIDLARYLGGEIVSVQARTAQREIQKIAKDATIPDVSMLSVAFKSGAIAQFSGTCLVGEVFRGGDVTLDLIGHNLLCEVRRDSLTLRQNGETHIFNELENPCLREDRAFIEAVATGKRTGIKSTYADAFKTLRVTLAANQSAKSGKPVKL
ncbi:MAG: myo-inositol 2-dehydrogenase / D-chiro-inositol 1-dehydrogenase [Abditibacteriota bacterium]|nr:myo-inositol 2-dehydrogenase / D-chiro-inositol 1-dehydrogenase [Abditibacteriota bacterium]